ncbi:MAG: response regulator [Limisphaerales bacterium]
MNPAPGTTPPATGSHSHLRVLLVDDVAMNRRVAELFLKHLGCTVVSTEDVAAAIVQIRAQEFDLVFTDVEMPETNGIEAIELFREADAAAHPARRHRLKIMAVSAGQIGMSHWDYLAAGFDEHLAKPIELEQLRAVLLKWEGEPPAPTA